MKRLKQHWHNFVDEDKYGGIFEDIMTGFLFSGVILLFLWALGKGLGVF